MITEWFVNLGTQFVAWLVTAFPSWSLPDWFVTLDDGLSGIFAMASWLGVWVDTAVVSTVLVAIIGTWTVSATIKLFLRAASHVPGGIGGAG